MSAENYIEREIASGRLLALHIAESVRIAQEQLGLEADGKPGPLTRQALEERLLGPKPGTIPGMIVRVAREEIGRGESGGNNRGPDMDRYNAPQGHSWCSWFASWVIIEAHLRLGLEPPIAPTGGAKKLWRRVGKLGSRSKEDPRPGDVVCWDRGVIDWYGHVEIVVAVTGSAFRTVAGNVGRYPSKVREYTHEIGEPRLMGFARAW